jgi:hypothetical protein
MSLSQTWAKTSLIFLIIAMTVGVYLRMTFFYTPFTINYKFILHTHSHLILLGWVFNAIAALLYYYYKDLLNARKSKVLFLLFQISLLGMMFTFPFQGYSLFSIIFSTMHILVSYFFVAHFLSSVQRTSNIANKFIFAGLVFYLISTIGPFALGPIMANGLRHSAIYDLAIYFYLHFLYNGFITLTILGLFFKSIESRTFNTEAINRSYVYFLYSVVPGFALSMFCYFNFGWLYAIGLIAALIQLAGFYYLFCFFKTNKKALKDLFLENSKFFYVALIAFGIKIMLQLFSSLPFTTEIVCNAHAIIIAYLHLVFIGFVTFSLMGLLFQSQVLESNAKFLKWGFYFLLLGFIGSEILIAMASIQTMNKILSANSSMYLTFIFSILMLVGVVFIFLSMKKKKFLKE